MMEEPRLKPQKNRDLLHNTKSYDCSESNEAQKAKVLIWLQCNATKIHTKRKGQMGGKEEEGRFSEICNDGEIF